LAQVLGRAFAKRQVNAAGVIDEDAQDVGARALQRYQDKLGVELKELVLDLIF